MDGDTLGDAGDNTNDIDLDNDSVQNTDDNCPNICNLDQADFDGDDLGNVCDAVTPRAWDQGSSLACTRLSGERVVLRYENSYILRDWFTNNDLVNAFEGSSVTLRLTKQSAGALLGQATSTVTNATAVFVVPIAPSAANNEAYRVQLTVDGVDTNLTVNPEGRFRQSQCTFE